MSTSAFGQFVLVNTNFADCNHFMGADWVIANLRNNRFITNAEQEANERAFMKYQRQILDHFVTLVRTLATSFPEHTIVVRPHPSEDHGTWREATSSLNNVTVIHEGDVNSWLLAAAVSIHNSCMTGIQGFLLERPTVAYEPVHSERFDYFLPNAVSSRAATTDEIATIVERHLKGPNSTTPKERSDRWKIAQRYLEGISGPLAADRIMDAMEGLERWGSLSCDPHSGQNFGIF